MSKLQVNSIYKHFGTIKAIDGLTLEVKEGELLAVLGPSGCGKSTLLSCIAGIEKPDHGEIKTTDGFLYSFQRKIDIPPESRNIGFVFQNYALWPHMSVFQNIAFPLKMRKKHNHEIREETMRALRLIRLEYKAERNPLELSGGEQQRVALGRALIMNPKLLLLDEPLSNLDARLRENMQDEIRTIQQKLGLTVIHVTHDQSEAMAMADRIAVMHRGKILQINTPAEIYENPQTRFVADFVGTNNLIKVYKDDNSGLLHCNNGLNMRVGPAVYGHRELGHRELGHRELGHPVCAVRPEDIHLFRASEAPTGQSVGRGVISKRTYKGAHILYEISAGSTVLRVQQHPEKELMIGETVAFTFTRAVLVEDDTI
jgi:iron(III) transport system ATP-binding protein